MLYAKLGLEKDTANSGVLHIDETLLRINKPAAQAAYNHVGTHGAAMLFRYLNSHEIKFQVFCEDGSTSTSSPQGTRMPLTVKQFTNASRTTITRIWYFTRHPEIYQRFKSYNSDYELYLNLIRERLIDMALVVAYGQPSPRPTYLSTMQYYTDQHSGIVVPLRNLEELDVSNKEAVSAIFKRPNHYVMESLKRYLDSTSSPKLQHNTGELLQAAKGAVLPRSPENDFWSSPEIVAIYGGHTAIYSMMHKIWADSRVEAQKKRYKNRTQQQIEDKNAYRREWRKNMLSERRQAIQKKKVRHTGLKKWSSGSSRLRSCCYTHLLILFNSIFT